MASANTAHEQSCTASVNVKQDKVNDITHWSEFNTDSRTASTTTLADKLTYEAYKLSSTLPEEYREHLVSSKLVVATGIKKLSKSICDAAELASEYVAEYVPLIDSGHTKSEHKAITAAAKERVRLCDVRRKEANWKAAAETSFGASKPIESVLNIRLHKEHENLASVEYTSARDVMEKVGSQTRQYYLALLEYFKVDWHLGSSFEEDADYFRPPMNTYTKTFFGTFWTWTRMS